MRHKTQTTVIGVFNAAVVEWRRREGCCRESFFDMIVAKHEEIGGPDLTGIVFDSNASDTFQRQRTNAERISRWLDDQTKRCTLLPPNFIPTLLAALPHDLRLQCIAQIVRPFGMEVRYSDGADTEAFNPAQHASGIIKESAEAATKMLSMSANPSPDEVEQVRKEVTDIAEFAAATLRALPACATKH